MNVPCRVGKVEWLLRCSYGEPGGGGGTEKVAGSKEGEISSSVFLNEAWQVCAITISIAVSESRRKSARTICLTSVLKLCGVFFV